MNHMNRIYLDYNATAPLLPGVLEAMEPFFKNDFGNASSVHSFGRDARYAVEVSRETIAQFINAMPEEIIFTSCGTESNNLAIKGYCYQNRFKGNHIITSQIEHPAVLNVCQALETEGFEVTYLPVSREGVVSIEALKQAITKKTLLISIMHANNETGVIQPLESIGRIAAENEIILHSDTVQTFGKTSVDVERLGLSMLSVSAHKIGGPKGLGFLYKKIGTEIQPQIIGGSHERRMRAGTENVPYIAGFAKAVEILSGKLSEKEKRLTLLRNKCEAELKKIFPDSVINGAGADRLPNTINISFPDVDGASLLRGLDLLGVAVSTGSACSSGALQQSPVLVAMGVPEDLAKGAIRVSLGEPTTEAELSIFIQLLKKTLEQARQNKS